MPAAAVESVDFVLKLDKIGICPKKANKYVPKATLFLAFFTALVEKSNFRHRSTNSTRPNHPKCLTFWLFSRRSAKSPTFDKFRHAASPMSRTDTPHSTWHMSHAMTAARHLVTRNGIIHRLRFEKALQLLTKRMESLAAELHCLSAARHEFAIQPKDYE